METFAQIFGSTGFELSTFVFCLAMSVALFHLGKTLAAGYQQWSNGQLSALEFGGTVMTESLMLGVVATWYAL